MKPNRFCLSNQKLSDGLTLLKLLISRPLRVWDWVSHFSLCFAPEAHLFVHNVYTRLSLFLDKIFFFFFGKESLVFLFRICRNINRDILRSSGYLEEPLKKCIIGNLHITPSGQKHEWPCCFLRRRHASFCLKRGVHYKKYVYFLMKDFCVAYRFFEIDEIHSIAKKNHKHFHWY